MEVYIYFFSLLYFAAFAFNSTFISLFNINYMAQRVKARTLFVALAQFFSVILAHFYGMN